MKRPISLLIAATATAWLTGCGGSAPELGSGRLSLTVTWPERDSRLIPAASNSLRIEILRGNPLVLERTVFLNRPATTVTITAVPEGTVLVRVSAHPGADGTGTAQARAEQTVDVTADQRSDLTLTLASTIATVEVTPADTIIDGDGETEVVLTATARDSSGNVVLVPVANAYTWTVTASPGVVSLDGSTSATTTATAQANGTATIQATENESGVSGTTTVTVGGGA